MRTHQTLGLMAAILVAAPLMMVPTAASAFDMGGLVRGAIARYAAQGGYRMNLGGGAHYAGVHVASHHSRSSNDDDADAMPGSSNTPPSKDIGMAPHGAQDGDRGMSQTTDSMKAVSTVRSESDELSFAPSR